MTESVWGVDAMEGVLDLSLFPLAPPVVWAYKTGTTRNPDIAWTEVDIARFPDSQIYRVHQGFGGRDPFRTSDGVPWDEVDMEAGAWTVPEVANAIGVRNHDAWSTRVYASDDPWQQLAAMCRQLGIGMGSVFRREANWSLSRSEMRARLTGDQYAGQWASPSSKPDTLVPGTVRTLRQANIDLNVVRLVPTQWRGAFAAF